MKYHALIACCDTGESLNIKMALDEEQSLASTAIATQPPDVYNILRDDHVDLVYCDLNFTDAQGNCLYQKLRVDFPEVVVVVQGAFASVQTAVDAMRLGISDYIAKPASMAHIRQSIMGSLARAELARQMEDERKKKLIRQLVASINHEINNPLTTILGLADLTLSESTDIGEKVRRNLEIIIDQCIRMRDVTTRLRHIREIRTTDYTESETMLDLKHPQPDESKQVAPTGRKCQVLIIDDNARVISMLTRLFSTEYNIQGCSSGAEGMERISAAPPDLAIVDLDLPDMDGVRLINRIHVVKPEVPTLLMTAYMDEHLSEMAVQNGARGILYKPIYSKEFRQAVNSALRMSGLI